MEKYLCVDCKLIEKHNPETGTTKDGRPYIKRTFVVETLGVSPKIICFTAWTKCADILNYINERDDITVYFNLSSRKNETNWFHDLNVWRIDKYKPQQQQQIPQQQPVAFPGQLPY